MLGYLGSISEEVYIFFETKEEIQSVGKGKIVNGIWFNQNQSLEGMFELSLIEGDKRNLENIQLKGIKNDKMQLSKLEVKIGELVYNKFIREKGLGVHEGGCNFNILDASDCSFDIPEESIKEGNLNTTEREIYFQLLSSI